MGLGSLGQALPDGDRDPGQGEGNDKTARRDSDLGRWPQRLHKGNFVAAPRSAKSEIAPVTGGVAPDSRAMAGGALAGPGNPTGSEAPAIRKLTGVNDRANCVFSRRIFRLVPSASSFNPTQFPRMNASVAPAAPLSSARHDRVFHTGMAVALLITAIAGFGPTYFFKPVLASPPLSPLLHIHGLVFTAWLVLLIVQSGLVRAHRIDLHKRLGIGGAVLATAMVVLGVMAAVYGARHGRSADGMEPLAFMIFPFGQTLLFGGFVGAALWKRRQPELHRRLILLGTICLMTPAISRIVDHRAVLASLLTLIFVVVAMIHDWKSSRRVHPLYIFGFAILLISGPGRAAFANTEAWQAFARFLVG